MQNLIKQLDERIESTHEAIEKDIQISIECERLREQIREIMELSNREEMRSCKTQSIKEIIENIDLK